MLHYSVLNNVLQDAGKLKFPLGNLQYYCIDILFVSCAGLFMHAEHDIIMAYSSVCTLHSGIVLKRMHILSNCFIIW